MYVLIICLFLQRQFQTVLSPDTVPNMTTADIDKTINQILDADDQGSDIYDIDEDINTTIDDVGSGPVDSGEEVAKTATSDPVNAKSSASAVSDSKKEVLVPPGQ